ncbi:Glycosyltransferase involved in cell wall bisynthesis [Haloechinothrix alba]|uniref:Glycosyltransferase involved in cell wall bisynthesis n=1 Tax=Haloechinothrix alba TaxID=664784 RepID=A0A238Z247_9PSEU|nr:glycosyltransferase family 4 protein [Haloechinothrix alba]SNR76914.1 Glycosyltransferase involved in cell wall bisynthesis [Haloechinothrix alba]
MSSTARWWPRLVKPPLRLTRRLAVRLVRYWVARPGAARASRPEGAPVKITFLLSHVYGMGGTIRTVLNVAGHLDSEYDIEITTVVRRRERPFFPIPPGVTVRVLHDKRDIPGRSLIRNVLTRLPSLLVHEEDWVHGLCSLWTDLQMARMLRALPPQILVTTRPGLNLLAAQLAPPWVTTVAQEHVSYQRHRPGIRRAVARDYSRLDALAVLTREDVRHYTAVLGDSGTHVVRITNALPSAAPSAVPLEPVSREKVVAAAGRLVPEKRFDLLIAAFELVTAKHPDWRLRIYGSGAQRERLQQQITRTQLDNHVHLMGRSNRLVEELTKASVFALPSYVEGFGLVVIEAMSAGLPVASFDAGGPAEIITHGHDGLLVPDSGEERTRAFAGALLDTIEHAEDRARMAAAAVETANGFDIDAVGRRWDELFRTLTR